MAESIKRIVIKLREKGKSYNYISDRLNIPKSTVRYWSKHIKLTDKQREKLNKNSRNPYYGKRKLNIENQIKNKQIKIKDLWSEGYNQVENLTPRELFLVGISLYWAEGFKKDTQLGFANSDFRMINLFIKWLKVCCDIDIDRLQPRITINISHKDRIDNIREYWSRKTNIPESQFRKEFYQKFKWSKKYSNRNEYFGVLRIKVSKSLDLLRKMNGWIAGLAIKC